MTTSESFQEWRARTKPSPEASELGRTTLFPLLVAAGVIVVFGDGSTTRLVLLAAFLVLFVPTVVLHRRILLSGAKVDDRRLTRLRWVQRGVCAASILGTLVAGLG